MSFGKRLKELRAERSMTQKQLGEKVNLSLKTISAYERDERRPDMDTLSKLSSFFGVTTNYLLGDKDFTEIQQEFPEGAKILTRANNELTPEQKQIMVNIMQAFIDSQQNRV